MDETAPRHWQDRWQLSRGTDYTTGPAVPQIAQQPSPVLGVGEEKGPAGKEGAGPQGMGCRCAGKGCGGRGVFHFQASVFWVAWTYQRKGCAINEAGRSCATRQGTCQSCGQGGKVVPWLRDMWKSSLSCRSVASGIAEAGQLSPVLFAPALIRKGSPWMICSMEEERQS